MKSFHGRGSQLALIALAAVSLTACASRPKPLGPVATAQTPPPPPPPPTYGSAPGPAPVEEAQETGAPMPGSERDFVVNAGDRVYFEFDRYTLRDDARPILDAQAAWLSRYPDVRVRVEGNCDERGTRDYNFALGSRRANTVKEYLASHGVSSSRIDTISYGKERPIETDNSDEGQSKNRNAHTVITQGAR